MNNLTPCHLQRLDKVRKELFDLFLTHLAKTARPPRRDILVKGVRFLRDGMHPGDYVLLAIAEKLDELLDALAVLEPEPHPANRFLGAIHQQPFREAPDTQRRSAQRLGRHVRDDAGQAFVHHINVKRRVFPGLQADVGAAAIPPFNVIRCWLVCLPRVATPRSLRIDPAGRLARLVGGDLRHLRQRRGRRYDAD